MPQSTSKPIRVGMIGCGAIAQIMHLPFVAELRGTFELGALCDISPAPSPTVASVSGCPPIAGSRRQRRWSKSLGSMRSSCAIFCTPRDPSRR